ncbi:MAG: SPASM domain-containing protein [Planctomycetes bacterium]|nr:SPASM domain-containing protein [Planctomycetota bacterium]
MYRNKYGLVKRCLCRLYEAVPPVRRIKGLFHPLRVRSFARRLEARRAGIQEARHRDGRPPLFDHVEIETFNRCNGECGFCPVNRHLDPRRATRMTDDLFTAIMEQLGALDYRGELCLYSNNESLLDDRIERFTEHARRAVPGCRLMLSTNGTLLTPERYQALIDNLDLLYVNNYCDDFALTPENQEILRLAESRPEWWRKTHIVVRYRREIMSSRGGQAPNKPGPRLRTLPVGCTYPASQLIVRPDGKLSLCCNDAVGVVTLGDLTQQSVLEAWYGEVYEDARRRLLESRDAFALCRHCDTLGD